MKKLVFNNLNSSELKLISKLCFELFINTEYSYKPTYFIGEYEIDRNDFIKLKQFYYAKYATKEEQLLHDQMKTKRRNVKVQSRYKEAFNAFINDSDTDIFYENLASDANVSLKTVKKDPKAYYEKFATSDEKKVYEAKKQRIENTKKTQKLSDVREKLKYIFDVCVNNCFNPEQVEMLTEKYSISPKTVYNYVLKYAELYANEEELNKYKEMKKKIISNKKKLPTYIIVINKLKELSIKEALEYLVDNKISIQKLSEFVTLYYNENKNEDISKIGEIYKNYQKYLKHEKEKEIQIKKIAELEKKLELIRIKKQELEIANKKKKILEMVKMIKSYNKSNYQDYKTFALKKKIGEAKFESALKVTKKVCLPVYNDYIEKERQNNIKANSKDAKTIFSVLEKLKEGKLEIVDYYGITKMPLDELLYKSKMLCKNEDYGIIEQFVNMNTTKNEYDINTLLNSNFTVMAYDKAITLNYEYNKKIIDFLIKKDIPVNNATFLSAIRKLSEKSKKKVA